MLILVFKGLRTLPITEKKKTLNSENEIFQFDNYETSLAQRVSHLNHHYAVTLLYNIWP